jgi:lysyl-tRNA synthetase class II
VLGTSEIRHAASGEVINFGGPWREVKYKDLIRETTGDADWFERSKAEKIAGAEKLGLYVDPQVGGIRDHQRDLLQEDRADPDPADLCHAPAEGAVPAGEDHPR